MLHNKQASIRKDGLELLACISTHCDRRTFLAGYQEWFTAAVGVLRGSSSQDSKQQQHVAAQQAGWQCLAVLFDRIGRMLDIPGVRRDGAALVPKLVALLQQQFPTTQAPTEPSAVLGSPAMEALLAAVTALPAPFRQHIKYIEPSIAATLMQPLLAPGRAMRLAAACAAALPRINGDGTSWSNMAQRLLATAHGLLDVLLLGLDDQSLVGTARDLLDPHAAPLPGVPSATTAPLPAYKAAFGQLEATLHALQALLTRSYPSPVPIPGTGLLLLVTRVLGVDDASGGPGKAGSSKFAELCLHLPALHAAVLRLLCTLLCAAGAQLASLYLTTARLLAGYLERVTAAGAGALTPLALHVRLQLYAATRLLLQSAGVGIVRPLAPVVLRCACAELYGTPAGTAGSAGRQPEAQQGPARKKARKSKGQGGALAEDEDGLLGGPKNDKAGAASAQTGLAAQAAMLGVLEALLTSGAGLVPAAERSQADAIAGHMAATMAAAAQTLSQDAEGDTSPLEQLHLAAYQALLASVLAPLGHRPPLLPLALRLFRAGVAGAGSPALAAWCQQALLSCEALLHPRSIPRPAPLRPLGAPAAGASAGAYNVYSNGTASPGAGASGEEVAAAGVPHLGKPMFWSYLDAGCEVQLAQQAEQMLQAGQRNPDEADLAGQPAPQQQQLVQIDEQQATCGDVMMGDALPMRSVETVAQQCGLITAQPGLSTAAAAQQQVQVHQPVSSMAAMMGGAPGGISTVIAAQQPSLALKGAAAVVAQALPAAAEKAAAVPAPLVGQPALAWQSPSVAAPTVADVQEATPAAAAIAAAAALAPSLAVAAGGESDSDGPLPEIDSGDEGSSSGSAENEEE
ncbi:hypothetical protein N2152v2_006549 [Parachlorella kessleri]